MEGSVRKVEVDSDKHSDLHGRHDMVRLDRKEFDHSGSRESDMVSVERADIGSERKGMN